MTSTIVIGCTAFVVILAGAFLGAEARTRLPKDYLSDETKSLVSMSTAVIATVAALVLGLLISNANTAFTRLGGEVTTLSSQILRLDHILRRYGPAAQPARDALQRYAESKLTDMFPDDPADFHLGNPATYELLQQTEEQMLKIKPSDPRDQWWLGQALTLAGKIGDARWLIIQQVGQGTPKAFVALLVFWLFLLFASFGLFAPSNLTSAITLTMCALAVAAAVAMFLELEQGFGGVVRISPEPMKQAVMALKASPRE
ncbi:hypothetical protein [Bradyrhizobium sp. RP6]|uniref:bestrophin-like domain n=1 Tax=Bradyrhizobium sp. RP6 TaxID=2489596 RepID=UPI000F5488EB|nr:hypothetical protein [Bradyrhizobium sp. RP6]RQH11654.1 hypothetical protein EHH60_18150 [Bradyrhizobium sp. RP6]